MSDDGYDSMEAEQDAARMACQHCGHRENMHRGALGCGVFGCGCRGMVVHASRIEPVEVPAAMRTLLGVQSVEMVSTEQAMPGEHVLDYATRIYDIHERTAGRMIGEFNGTQVEIIPELSTPELWVQEWAHRREQAQREFATKPNMHALPHFRAVEIGAALIAYANTLDDHRERARIVGLATYLPESRCPETVLRHGQGIQCTGSYDHDGRHEWESD